MWILLQLVLAYSNGEFEQMVHDVKVHSVKLRTNLDRFEKKHTKSCNKIVNRLRYMADAESLGLRMEEQDRRMKDISAHLYRARSVNKDIIMQPLKENHLQTKERYNVISSNYYQCISSWPDARGKRRLAGR